MVRNSPLAATLAGLVALITMMMAANNAAAQPEPSGPHPRIVLGKSLRDNWRRLAGVRGSATARAVARCQEIAGAPDRFRRDLYMGLDWAQNLQSCLVAWAATDRPAHANTAMRYFVALLDDLDAVGDGKGGDQAARRNSGFAIRAMGSYTALAYDWLHGHPGMTPAIKARARQRWKAWTSWYLPSGYRARSPGTNYQAGYLLAATLIAIAQGGEAGADGASLWRHVATELWNGDMAKALRGGVLEGGDWGEGFQYAPLSIASYALSARAMTDAGVAVPGMSEFLAGVLMRHVYGSAEDDTAFVGGDTQAEGPNLPVQPNALYAVALGNAPDDSRSWARAEIERLRLRTDDFLLFAALAEGLAPEPKPLPRASWQTWYLAKGVGNLYARTRWGSPAVWTVMQCVRTIDIDHFHANAGNLIVSRGRDHLLVDPSPYGTLSTLTSNAPTVHSAQLPPEYQPGQAYWSERTRWDWAHQTQGGVVVGRCDYADQYKFQERPSDVPQAARDMVVVPWRGGADASVVVLDRARSGAADRGLHLRFRSQQAWMADRATAATMPRHSAVVGRSAMHLTRVAASGGTAEVAANSAKDCFGENTKRGNCDAARFPVSDVRLQVPGPTMSAIHVLDAVDQMAAPTKIDLRTGTGYRLVSLERGTESAVVVEGTGQDMQIPLPARATRLVVVGGPEAGGKAEATAVARGAVCEVTVKRGTAMVARPLVIAIDAQCRVTEDARMSSGPPAVAAAAAVGGDLPPAATPDAATNLPTTTGQNPSGSGSQDTSMGNSAVGPLPRSPRAGCCGAQSSPTSSLLTAGWVTLLLGRRRRRRPTQ